MLKKKRKIVNFEDLPIEIQQESLAMSMYGRSSYPNKAEQLSRANLIENMKTDTQVYVFRDGNKAIVIYRGTEKNIKDIITDLWAFKRHIPYKHTGKIRVHSGFLNAYISVQPEVLRRVTNLRDSGCTSVLIGDHSLGGALATASAIDIQYKGIFDSDSIRGYTDGQPRFGNRHFAESFNKRVPNFYRCRNKGDVVPLVPLFATHIGIEVRTGKLKKHDINNYIKNKLAII